MSFAPEAIEQSEEPVDLLRQELKARNLNAFLVPLTDEYQNEYIPANAKRLSYLTRFDGSAGFCIVTLDKAVLFVDGRYTLEAKATVNETIFAIKDYTRASMTQWLKENLSQGDVVGFDPWLHTTSEVDWLEQTCSEWQASLEAQEGNLVDAIWRNRPEAPKGKIQVQPLEYAGQDHEDKIKHIQDYLNDQRLGAVAVTATDSVAWLLNLRGQDIPFNPVFLSYAIVKKTGQVDLVIDPAKLTPDAMAHLGPNVTLIDESDIKTYLNQLGREKLRIQMDENQAPYGMGYILEKAGAKLTFAQDPCSLPKAIKNNVELEGARSAHIRDGVALCKFMYWLAQNATSGHVTEIIAAEKLKQYRQEDQMLMDLSFDTISGAGPNGAIIHYRVNEKTNRPIEENQIYLFDSGGQYRDGTTDVTRTIVIGAATAEQKDRFTRVLKGHIALASTYFPRGTTGSQLDVLARHSLWQAGLDYAHGTGHGVGSYLNVHEGPQRISKLPSTVALEPGMILSNEPGYYKAGEFGIRIENLVAVVPCVDIEDAETQMLEFEDLTLVPIDRDLIMTDLMTEAEITWLNDYHAKVRKTLMPLLDEEVGEWLAEVTAPL